MLRPSLHRRLDGWVARSTTFGLTALLLAAITTFPAERISISDGLGWDGAGYALVTADVIHYAFGRALSDVGIQRYASSDHGCRRTGARDLEPTNSHIIAAFMVLNVLSIGSWGPCGAEHLACWG